MAREKTYSVKLTYQELELLVRAITAATPNSAEISGASDSAFFRGM